MFEVGQIVLIKSGPRAGRPVIVKLYENEEYRCQIAGHPLLPDNPKTVDPTVQHRWFQPDELSYGLSEGGW